MLVGLTGWFLGRPLIEMFMTGVSLAVAIVPEGLPAVVTITLALGVRAMVRRRALLRRLRAAETLGGATVIRIVAGLDMKNMNMPELREVLKNEFRLILPA